MPPIKPKKPEPELNPIEESLKKLHEYEQLVKTDKYTLDDDLMAQPDLFNRVSQQCEDLSRERDTAKVLIEEERARLDKEIREGVDPDEKKPSETQIVHMINLHPDMQEAQRTYIDVKWLHGKWVALKNSLEQRSHSMRELAGLFNSGYFALATGSKARGDARDREAAKVREEQASRRRGDG